MNIIDEMVLTAYNARRQLVGLQYSTINEKTQPRAAASLSSEANKKS